jgi:hypothetical protein
MIVLLQIRSVGVVDCVDGYTVDINGFSRSERAPWPSPSGEPPLRREGGCHPAICGSGIPIDRNA